MGVISLKVQYAEVAPLLQRVMMMMMMKAVRQAFDFHIISMLLLLIKK